MSSNRIGTGRGRNSYANQATGDVTSPAKVPEAEELAALDHSIGNDIMPPEARQAMRHAASLIRKLTEAMSRPVSDEEFSAAFLDMFSLAHGDEETDDHPALTQNQRGAVICQILLRRRFAAIAKSRPEAEGTKTVSADTPSNEQTKLSLPPHLEAEGEK